MTTAHNKGTNYIFVAKTLLRRRGGDLEARFRAELSDEERTFHESALATTWLDADMTSRLLARAGQLLFPERDRPLEECGRLEAHEHLSTGVYRVLVPLLSVETVVRQAAKLWSRYHDRGDARAEIEGPGRARMIATGYPDLSPELRDIVAGYVAGAIEAAGAKDVKVTVDETDPENRIFVATYERS